MLNQTHVLGFFLNQKSDLLAYIQDRSKVYPRANTEGQTSFYAFNPYRPCEITTGILPVFDMTV